jgi:hypothetical protein
MHGNSLPFGLPGMSLHRCVNYAHCLLCYVILLRRRYIVVKLAGIGALPSAAVHTHLHLIQTVSGAAALIAMMAADAILARSRHLQVQELSEELRLIESDL